jgi:hypothetical protein
VAEEDTQILYMDVSQQDATSTELDYFYDGSTPGSISLSGAGKPTLVHSSSGALTGSYLDFNSAHSESLGFHDGDNDPDEGYFVVVVFRPDVLTGSDVQAIFSKADAGGFAVELAPSPSSILRFGARVLTSYEYATKPTSALSTNRLHLMMGAYDGNGKLRMWVDASDSGVTETATMSSGVVQNDSPIRIGADPEGVSNTRFYFDGAIQMVSLHKWRNH